ncbi:MAG TPA: DsbE family thiol:disulfide interchange protein [Alphaproteobacteria bacterium]|jgi:cytochrome c biogenesis protein CcmG/thiol:disulfide interchange protein DsbE|nr:DsbE family thiol:disulfide interchange protein [Alphaproteobacteria bacterium]
MTDETSEQRTGPGRYRWLLAVLPLSIALIVGAFLYVGLFLKPREIPSALIDKPVPQFRLPAIPGGPPGLEAADLKGQVSLVNVFASWCVPCRAEHPLLTRLKADSGVPLYGINYKDRTADVLGWLGRLGNPFDRIGADRDGQVAIDWGVYGVPETFLIDAHGTIVCKQVGPLTAEDVSGKMLPAIAALKAGRVPQC